MIDADFDWASFLGRHDLTWSVKPVSWDEGAFIGNGWMGAMIYSEEHKHKRNVLRFVLGRTDVTARRPGGGYPPRVPVGELHLELAGWIYQPCTMHLDLWNAELRADITTTVGRVEVRTFVHSRDMALAVEVETFGGESGAVLQWYPYSEVDPVLKNADGYNLNQYIPKSEVARTEMDGIHIGMETFLPRGSGGCTTAWKELGGAGPSGERRLLVLSICNGAGETAAVDAVNAVREAARQPWDEWLQSHRSWWHDYYRQSFVSLPDTMLEGFYWIQMYKLAAATRAEAMIIDNQGPWLAPTPWAGVWFNMNVQMAYSPVYTSNRLDIGRSLVKAFRDNFANLISNVPEEYREDSAGLGRSCSYDLVCPVGTETGNLLWVCHNLWRQYRHAMDGELLSDLMYPLLRKAVQYHIHLLEEGEDGKLHLPPTISPEYGSFLQLTVPDTHYDLALLRWACETLLHISLLPELRIDSGAGQAETMREQWMDVLERLMPLPVDETGYMIGRGQPLKFGHRHFSHLMAVFPLHLISGDVQEERELALRSLRHWLSREGDLRGFTFTGAASIAATLGLGDEALQYVKSLMHLLKPNTMYKEAGPVIESPLAGAEAIHDMLLQSWGDGIRVFPAVPAEWLDAAFHDLRAEGAFLVSAVRRAGRTAWIRVKSLAGEPCRVKAGFTGAFRVEGSGKAEVHAAADGWLELDLPCGEEVDLVAVEFAEHKEGAPSDNEIAYKVRPVPAQQHLCGYFGGRKPWRLYSLPVIEITTSE